MSNTRELIMQKYSQTVPLSVPARNVFYELDFSLKHILRESKKSSHDLNTTQWWKPW